MSKYVYSYSFGKEIYSFQAESLLTVLQEILDLYVEDGSVTDLSIEYKAVEDEFNVKLKFQGEDFDVDVPAKVDFVLTFLSIYGSERELPYFLNIVEVN